MDCSSPPQLTDEQISRWLDGRESPILANHLEQCTFCRNRLEQARLIESSIQRAIYRTLCPSSDELVDYVMDFLDGEQKQAIDTHLDECSHCRDEIQTLIQFAEQEEIDHSARGSSKGRIIVPPKGYFSVELVEYKSLRAVRGIDGKQFRASANGINILCDIQLATKGIALTGTIIENNEDTGWAKSLIEIRQENAVVHLCPLDSFGMFRCEPIDEGSYTIRIVAQDGRVLDIPNIEINLRS